MECIAPPPFPEKTNKLYGVPENLDNKEKHAVLSVRLSIFFLLKLNTLFFLNVIYLKTKNTVVVTYLLFPTFGGPSYFQLFYLLIHFSYIIISRVVNLLTN